MNVLVPKQVRSHKLTRDQRLQISVLYFDANWTRDQICLQTGYTYRQVCQALSYRVTPQKQKAGCKVLLNTPAKKRLVEWVTASQTNRETLWRNILSILGWDCGEYAIRTALKREGFKRCVKRRKCHLTEDYAKDKLTQAEEHVDQTNKQWDNVLFSDEVWA